MENQGFQQNQHQQPYSNVEHPDASTAQILGIISIPIACSLGIVGLILGIISMSKAKKAIQEMNANPGKYSQASASKLNTGKTCGTIGLVLSILNMLFWIVYIVAIVALAASGELN